MPGNLLLGARYLNDNNIAQLADELMNSCYDAWTNTPTGLAPETWSWIEKSQDLAAYPEHMQNMVLRDGFIAQDTGYDLRPGSFGCF